RNIQHNLQPALVGSRLILQWPKAPSQPVPKSPDVKSLYQLREQAIREEYHRQINEINERQRLQLDGGSQWRKGETHAPRHDCCRRREHDGRGGALKERDFLGANHVDDERLREQADHEPAGLKERLFRQRVRSEYIPHYPKSQYVKDRTDWAD